MFFRWLKRFLPRGLFGRAILILLVPVVAVQLVVSVVFLQRHFDRVTEQMTRSVAIPLRYMLAGIDAAPDAETARQIATELGQDLGFVVGFEGDPVMSSRVFYDLSGRSIIRTMHRVLPAVTQIDLGSDLDFVRLAAETEWGLAEIRFARGRVSASNPHQLLVIMVFAGLLMTAVAYIFLRNQLRPITRLAAASDAFGKGRIVPYRPRGATEVRAAGAAFLDMRARIERAREQRNLLLSGVSHDLRTPLTRFRLALSLLDEDDDTRAMVRDVSEMERMLDDFLAYARGEFEGEVEAASPTAIARKVVGNAERIGRAVTLTLHDDVPETAAMRVHAVQRALQNLVQNALRYGQNVQLTVSPTREGFCFVVEDDGPGIPKDRQDEALRPFTRLDPARNQDKGGGAGLGLAIALDIARAHGGTLRLGQSEALGGLKVTFALPG